MQGKDKKKVEQEKRDHLILVDEMVVTELSEFGFKSVISLHDFLLWTLETFNVFGSSLLYATLKLKFQLHSCCLRSNVTVEPQLASLSSRLSFKRQDKTGWM